MYFFVMIISLSVGFLVGTQVQDYVNAKVNYKKNKENELRIDHKN